MVRGPVTRLIAVKKLFRKTSEQNASYAAFLSIILEMRRMIGARGDSSGDEAGGTSYRGFFAESQTGTSDLNCVRCFHHPLRLDASARLKD